jgi:hypothetical protein
MKKENGNYKGPIISAVIGGIFFSVPYLVLDVPIAVSLGIGVVAFGAGNLIFSDNSKNNNLVDEKRNLYDILKVAKEQNARNLCNDK